MYILFELDLLSSYVTYESIKLTLCHTKCHFKYAIDFKLIRLIAPNQNK